MINVSFKSLGSAGRFANQLFQLSALMSYCKKYGFNPQFPTWAYAKYFKYDFSQHFNDKITVDGIYNEPTFHYTEIPEFTRSTELSGYFQSTKYHTHINIHELFELKDEYRAIVDAQYNAINPNGKFTCSFHVRRGDYTKEPQLSYHGLLGIEHYDEAIAYIQKNTLHEFIPMVMSDDIEWCKRNFKGPPAYEFIEGNEPIIDLFLMAKCHVNVIANSSFSLWAGLLNQNSNKKIIAPKSWFWTAGLDTSDLLDKNWIRL